jgi:chromosome segregation ATPase
MKELKIDVDNLCSFMPQDKVGNFSQQTPKGILQKTLEAITSIDNKEKTLREVQVELTELQVNRNQFQSQLDAKQKTLAQSTQELASMESDVQRINKRKENEELLEILKMKLSVQTVKQQKDVVADLNRELQAVEKILSDKQDEIEPLESYERDIKKGVSMYERNIEIAQKGLSSSAKTLNESVQGAEDLDGQLVDLTAKINNAAKSRRTQEKKRDEIVKNIEKVKRTIASAENKVTDVEVRLREAKSTQDELNQDIRELRGDPLEEAKSAVEDIDRGLNELQRELKAVKDPYVIFKKRLEVDHRNKDEIEFMEEFRAKKDSLKFHKEVYGPVGMYLDIKDPVVAAMADKAIPRGKQLAYIVQTVEDERKLRSLQRRVQVVTMTNLSTPPRAYSKAFLSDIKMPGLVEYLTDQIKCPDVVQAYLIDACNLGNHLLVRTENLSNFRDEHLERLCPLEGGYPPYANVFVLGRGGEGCQLHSGTRSRYQRSNLSMKTEEITPHRNSVLGPLEASASAGSGELEARKNDLTQKRMKAEAELKNVQDQIKQLEGRRNNTIQVIAALRKEIDKPAQLLRELDKHQKDLRDIEKLLSKSSDSLTADLKKDQKKKVEQTMKICEAMVKIIHDRSQAEIKLAVDEEALKVVNGILQNAQDAVLDAQNSLAVHKTAAKHAKKRRDEAIQDCKKCEEDYEKLVIQKFPQLDKDARNAAFRKYWKDVVVIKVPETDVDIITQRIDTVQGQINNISDNPQLLARYNKLKAEVEYLQEEVRKMENEAEGINDKVDQASERWVEQVESVTEKISVQFSKYMTDLSYDGEVHLVKKGTFDEYEIAMKVRFRDVEMMSELSGHRHSGGERAVSTIMYLMALQEMTHVPFRAVDEINQGMDERNERLVFDRIVKSCCSKENRPQYFLVSPKLLQGLRAMEHDDVTVLMIWNGPGVTHTWKFSEAVENATNVSSAKKRARHARDEDDDDDDDDEAPQNCRRK